MFLRNIYFRKYILNKKHISVMTFRRPKTIFALSSGQGKCGVAVIRVSGPDSGKALRLLTNSSTLPLPRTANLRNIKDPKTGETLDQGLALWFPGPKSFTGEDCFELQVHGSPAVINAIFKALGSIGKLRPAEAGEFTRRAFYNLKMDLTEVEGLADLLHAETEAQRKQAFLQYQGSLGKKYEKWRLNLMRMLVSVEASIDFEETEDLDESTNIIERTDIVQLRQEILEHVSDGRRGERLRNGVKTVILGEPNAGKSSLLNILCQRPAAIVSHFEGTTRDIVEVTQDIAGYPVIILDTAGLGRSTSDVIEKEGMLRARKAYENADLVILLIDALKLTLYNRINQRTTFNDYFKYYTNKLGLAELADKEQKDLASWFNGRCIIVINKNDLVVEDKLPREDIDQYKISCKNETGITSLLKEIENKLKVLCGEPSASNPSMNQIRHRTHLENVVKKLDKYLQLLDAGVTDEVILAETIRQAVKHFSFLTGRVTTEDVLDILFKDFCIGK